jgi:Branched-chain amino acid ABC-type transport system, permease components
MIVLQQLINGLQVGSIYALIALGYSMVYGIIMLLNFAHGDIIMVGSYIALLIISAGIHPLLAVLAAVVGCMALACLIEKAAYTPLRQAPRISLLITAIGVSYFLENMAQLIMGANPMAFPNTAVIPSKTYNVGGLNVSLTTIVTLVTAVIAMSLLTLLVQKTRSGKAMRAVSEDMGAAQLLIAVMIFKPSGLLGRRDFSMTALIERLMNPGLRKAEKEAERHD